MIKYLFPLAVLATMFVADHGLAAGYPQAPKRGMPASSLATANSNGVRSLDRDRGLERAAERRNVQSTAKTGGHVTHKLTEGRNPNVRRG